MQDRRAIAGVALAAAAFSTSAPLAKLATGLSPLAVASLRTGLAALVLGLVLGRDLTRAASALTPGDRARVAGAGLLLALHFALWLLGLARTSIAAASALVATQPLAILVAASATLGLRPARREIAGILAATAGAAVVASASGGASHTLAGDALVLGAVVVYAAYVVVTRRLREAAPALPYAALVYGASSLALAPLAVATSIGEAAPPSRAWLAVIGLALVPTLVGHTLAQRAARSATPLAVAMISPGETIGSIAIGAALLREVPSTRELAGAGLIVLGLLAAVTARRPPPAEPPPSK